MKILLVCQHYYPEPFRVTKIAEDLVRRGHVVTVLTGIPNYPEGEYYPGYSKRESRNQTINGVEIKRAFELPRKKGFTHRVLNYYSFSFFGNQLAKRLPGTFDCVFTVGLSPIMMANPAIAYKKRWGVPILMYEMDLWPESLLAGGIKKGSLIYNHYEKVSRNIYSQMDRILVTSKSHIDYINSLTHKPNLISWLPQFADDPFDGKHNPPPKKETDVTTFLFAGNIGKAQSCITILRAAEKLLSVKKVRFLFVGSGSELTHLQDYRKTHSLTNVEFVGRVPLKEMNKYYQQADCAIVSLSKDSYCQMTVPGKVQSYLKAGLPILAIDSGETSRWVRDIGCGMACPSENAEALCKIVLDFIALPTAQKEAYSAAGRSYFEDHLTEARFMDELEKSLLELIGDKQK